MDEQYIIETCGETAFSIVVDLTEDEYKVIDRVFSEYEQMNNYWPTSHLGIAKITNRKYESKHKCEKCDTELVIATIDYDEKYKEMFIGNSVEICPNCGLVDRY